VAIRVLWFLQQAKRARFFVGHFRVAITVRLSLVRYPILVDLPWEPTKEWIKELGGLNVSLLSSPRDPESILRTIENALNINGRESKF
jgi:hypothetical protein